MSVDTFDLDGLRLGRPATAAAGVVSVILGATSYIVWATTPNRKSVIRKIMWYDAGTGGCTLRFGYLNLGAVFVPCLPAIVTVNGMDGQLDQNNIPMCGNASGGFIAETTAVTGTLGNIIVQGTGAGIAAGIQVQIEVEEFGA